MRPDEVTAEFKIMRKTASAWRVEEPQDYTIKRKGDIEVRVFYKKLELTQERKDIREKCRKLIPENAVLVTECTLPKHAWATLRSGGKIIDIEPSWLRRYGLWDRMRSGVKKELKDLWSTTAAKNSEIPPTTLVSAETAARLLETTWKNEISTRLIFDIKVKNLKAEEHIHGMKIPDKFREEGCYLAFQCRFVPRGFMQYEEVQSSRVNLSASLFQNQGLGTKLEERNGIRNMREHFENLSHLTYDNYGSPVSRRTARLSVAWLASQLGQSIKSIDISRAFLQSRPYACEEVEVLGVPDQLTRVPELQGLLQEVWEKEGPKVEKVAGTKENIDIEGGAAKLLALRSIYGLKDAPERFFNELRLRLVQGGFETSANNPGLMYKRVKGGITIISAHVDDLLYTTTVEGEKRSNGNTRNFAYGKYRGGIIRVLRTQVRTRHEHQGNKGQW